METIALQLTNKTPLSEVSKVISDIKSDLQSQQSSADTLRSEHNTECHDETERLTNLIQTANEVSIESKQSIAILD